jgi:hypothetical protein
MPVATDLPSLAQDTHVQGAGVAVEATRKLVRLGVEAPEVSSAAVGWWLNASRPPWSAEEGASISINRVQATAYSVRCAPAASRA